jgi:hypothetical protein
MKTSRRTEETIVSEETVVSEESVASEETAVSVQELEAQVCELQATLMWLEERLYVDRNKTQKPGRMHQVLEVLKHGPISTMAIAERVGIQTTNVSSQLAYLRKGKLNNMFYHIGKDSLGRHVLQGETPVR